MLMNAKKTEIYFRCVREGNIVTESNVSEVKCVCSDSSGSCN